MNQISIPFFSLERQTKQLKKSFQQAFEKILDTQQFIGGKSVEEFEQALAQYLGVAHVISCNSGTDALWLAIHALSVEPQSIVLTTPFSFIASSSELLPHHAFPVFIDVDPVTFNICPEKISTWLKEHAYIKEKKAYHRQTGFPIAGIIPVHLFGQCADMEKIQAIAAEWNLWVIEDTAQAIGSSFNNKKAGTIGDIGTFSFYPTKNLGAFGDGGCCVTNNPELGARLLKLRNHGRKNHYKYEEYGLNSRLDAIQAEVLLIKLSSIESYNKRRLEIAHLYKKLLSSVDFLTLPQENNGLHTYHQYAVIIDQEKAGKTRDEFADYLSQHGIGSRVFYPEALHQISFLNKRADLYNPCPIAENLTKNILALPIWPELTDEEIIYIGTIIQAMPIKKFYTDQTFSLSPSSLSI